MPDRSAREMHFHVAIRVKQNFAHLQIAQMGLKGHFSKPRDGWSNMAKYLLVDSAVKLPVHLDQSPLVWPTTCTQEEYIRILREKDENEARQEEQGVQKKDAPEEKDKKKRSWSQEHKKVRKMLQFNEFSDYIIDNCITNEQEFWQLAVDLKEKGHPSLFHYGGLGKVAEKIQRANKAYMAAVRDDIFPDGSKNTSSYPFSAFILPEDVKTWMKEETNKKALIISGKGGIGKNQNGQSHHGY
eukprot:s965_g15.t1